MSSPVQPARGRSAGAGVVLLLGLVISGCSGSAITSPSATTATTGATGTPPLATATPSSPPLPVAEIVTADASIAGALGTYDMDGRGSDAPWLPFDSDPPINLTAHDTLTLRFVDGAAIGDAQVAIAAAADTTGRSPQGVPSGPVSSDGASLTVGPLPAGQWVLQARLSRADGRGDGVTYWAATVR